MRLHNLILAITFLLRDYTVPPEPPRITAYHEEPGPAPTQVGSGDFMCQFAPSVVAIYVGGETTWRGSGVVLEERLVLTAMHVILSAIQGDAVYARSYMCDTDGMPGRLSPIKLKLVTYDITQDLALLSSTLPAGKPAKLNSTRRGRAVWIYSAARWGSRGFILSKADDKELTVAGKVESGDSGGALVNERGEVVGIVLAHYRPHPIYVGRALIDESN